MPFMPVGMAREFDESWKASTGEWVKRTLVAWEQVCHYLHISTGALFLTSIAEQDLYPRRVRRS